MRFKVGDKVRVKKDLEVDKEYGGEHFVGSMEEYKGQIVTVISVKTAYYEIEEDDRSFVWTDEMLEPIEKEKNNMNIEKLNEEYKNKMDALMEEYRDKVKEIAEEEEPFIKEKQDYFVINNMFEPDYYHYANDDYDKQYLECGNMFPFTDENREQVEKEVSLIAERRKLQSEMEMFARQNNEEEIDWNNCKQEKLCLFVNRSNNEIGIEYIKISEELNTVYFTSKEVAEKALEKFEDRIRELYIDNTIKEGEE